MGLAIACTLAGCEKKAAIAGPSREAKLAEDDWKERVAQAREYAERKKRGEPIVSALGVKELPSRPTGDSVEVVDISPTATPEEKARLRQRIRTEMPIVMYATSWCGVCAAARGYMQTSGIRFTERDVERESDAQLACLSINPRCSVPTFDIDGLVMVGFRGKRLDAMIERATDLKLERMMERQTKTIVVGQTGEAK